MRGFANRISERCLFGQMCSYASSPLLESAHCNKRFISWRCRKTFMHQFGSAPDSGKEKNKKKKQGWISRVPSVGNIKDARACEFLVHCACASAPPCFRGTGRERESSLSSRWNLAAVCDITESSCCCFPVPGMDSQKVSSIPDLCYEINKRY